MTDPRIDPVSELTPEAGSTATIEEREIETGGRNLRQHAARGTMINSGFQAGLAGLGVLQRVLVAAFLTRSEFGLWGILISTLVTLSWLKQLGISDKYVQQADADQEVAYQKAFTLELGISLLFFIFCVAVLPLYALAYGHPEIIFPGVVLAATVPISAFESPVWISYRRMQFVRQRTLSAVDTVVAFAVTITLGVLGAGYWSLVIGALSGSVAGAIVCTIASPYPVRLRFDRGTLKEYASFSWPLVGFGVSNLLVVQGTLLVANDAVGLAGVGAIGLAGSIATLADRLDGIISQTIYPAVCAVADRAALLHEAFVKSNRVTLMWSMPFGVGLALFSGDLVHYGLGARWEPAIGILGAVGLIAGVGQIAFNWSIFMRAVNDTRPLFIASLINLASFVVFMVPALLLFGLTGYALAMGASTLIQLAARAYFLRRIFPGFAALVHISRAIAPSLPAAAVVLAMRLVVNGNSLGLALLELG
ncbi:MAG: lipopolysaccharide exporter, partial [Solirubrobacterales bacterium]|nr:lipopolysaccharide exporter [Solirubrobacterales bacterium]